MLIITNTQIQENHINSGFYEFNSNAIGYHIGRFRQGEVDLITV